MTPGSSENVPTSPRVTVLLPVFNGETFLSEAIESILAQTFKDFEFLIIDDGSTDASEEIVHSYSDPRIRFIRNGKNLRLSATLNKGIALSRAEYIARMDCDDMSLPERLEHQVRYMDSHPEVSVLGTQIHLIDEQGRPFTKFKAPGMPVSTLMTHWSMFFRCSVAHPSVIMRRSIFDVASPYDPRYSYSQDYELWVRLLYRGFRICSLPDQLLMLRRHQGSVTHAYSRSQVRSALKAIRVPVSGEIGRPISDQILSAMQMRRPSMCAAEALETAETIYRLLLAFIRHNSAAPEDYDEIRADAFMRVIGTPKRVFYANPVFAVGMFLTCCKIDPRRTFRLLRDNAETWLCRLGIRKNR